MMHNMMKRALALVLTVVMVFGLAPAGVLAVQTGFTASPNASGSLTAVNPAEAISSNGPMSLNQCLVDAGDLVADAVERVLRIYDMT